MRRPVTKTARPSRNSRVRKPADPPRLSQTLARLMPLEKARSLRKWDADIVGRLPSEIEDALSVLKCAEELMIDWGVLDALPETKKGRAAR